MRAGLEKTFAKNYTNPPQAADIKKELLVILMPMIFAYLHHFLVNWRNISGLHGFKPTWNLHGTYMKSTWNLHETYIFSAWPRKRHDGYNCNDGACRNHVGFM